MDSLAQARRKQRVQGKAPSPKSNGNEAAAAVSASTSGQATQTATPLHRQRPLPPTSAAVATGMRQQQQQQQQHLAPAKMNPMSTEIRNSNSGSMDGIDYDDSILNRSLETGQGVETLLASLKVRKGGTSTTGSTFTAVSFRPDDNQVTAAESLHAPGQRQAAALVANPVSRTNDNAPTTSSSSSSSRPGTSQDVDNRRVAKEREQRISTSISEEAVGAKGNSNSNRSMSLSSRGPTDSASSSSHGMQQKLGTTTASRSANHHLDNSSGKAGAVAAAAANNAISLGPAPATTYAASSTTTPLTRHPQPAVAAAAAAAPVHLARQQPLAPLTAPPGPSHTAPTAPFNKQRPVPKIRIVTDTPIDNDAGSGSGTQSPILYDAACFQNPSNVMLQLRACPSRCLAAQSMSNSQQDVVDDDDGMEANVHATMHGLFLGEAHEILQIARVYNTANYSAATNAAVPSIGEDEATTTTTTAQTPDYVCFGDTVTVQWQTSITTTRRAQHKVFLLGVRPKPIDENNPRTGSQQQQSGVAYNVAFYPPARGNSAKSQHWIVFAATTTSTDDVSFIKVGAAALEEDAVQRRSLYNGNGGSSTLQPSRRPVRAGDAVVLRNCATGGILSLSVHDNDDDNGYDMGNFALLTDAHRQAHVAPPLMDEYYDEEVVNPNGQPSLLTRLHRSDRLVPSVNEVFVVRQTASPPLPLWYGPSSNSKLSIDPGSNIAAFLDGSYLLRADRHEQSTSTAQDALTKTLFGPNNNEAFPIGLLASRTPRETELLDEILGACLGYEGQFIKAAVDGGDEQHGAHTSTPVVSNAARRRFALVEDEGAPSDSINRNLVQGMLPLITHLTRVRCFVSLRTPGYEYGAVMQAFCASLSRLFDQFVAEVVSWHRQYRQESLTLASLQIHLQSTARSLSILSRICGEVQAESGGALINALLRLKAHAYSGDVEAERLLQILTDAALVPFMDRLMKWLELGILSDDPHDEFMIQRNDKSTTWEQRYSVYEKNVLHHLFLTSSTLKHVLAAGRYWSALRLSEDKSTSSRNEGYLSIEPNPSLFVRPFDSPSSSTAIPSLALAKYRESSRALIQKMFDDYRLLDALRLMKRFFLMEDGDFYVGFLDCTEEELLKELPQISRNRVQHWMNTCLHGGDQRETISADKDSKRRNRVSLSELRCRFSEDGLTNHLDRLDDESSGGKTETSREPWTPLRHTYGATIGSKKGELSGLDTFYLEMNNIPFPTSIVLSEKALESYQVLFRHLFYAKFVERRLVSIWKDHQMLKGLQALRGPMGATFLLLQRMLHFIQNLICYCMFEVIEPQWLEMENGICGSVEQTVDDILRIHTGFLQQALQACLLTNRTLMKALTKLLKTCLLFSEQMKRFMKATKIEEEQTTVAMTMQKDIRHGAIARSSGPARATNGSSTRLRQSLHQSREERAKRLQRQSSRVEREVCGEPYRRMVVRFEEVFSKNLREFMAQLMDSNDSHHAHKANLYARLDCNGYMTRSLELS